MRRLGKGKVDLRFEISDLRFRTSLKIIIVKQHWLSYCDLLMNPNNRIMQLFNFVLIAFSLLGCSPSPNTDSSTKRDVSAFHQEALAYCTVKGFNQDYYFLVDYATHSGKFRFWVFDFETNAVVDSGLVSHGACNVFEENANPEENVKTSNVPDSHCSSLGKYKVGSRDYSTWGVHIKYWLNGLESTNDNAVERVVVLHSWEAVGDEEIYPHHAALSWGCPAVSDDFMLRLDNRLQKQTKPTLLWIVKD